MRKISNLSVLLLVATLTVSCGRKKAADEDALKTSAVTAAKANFLTQDCKTISKLLEKKVEELKAEDLVTITMEGEGDAEKKTIVDLSNIDGKDVLEKQFKANTEKDVESMDAYAATDARSGVDAKYTVIEVKVKKAEDAKEDPKPSTYIAQANKEDAGVMDYSVIHFDEAGKCVDNKKVEEVAEPAATPEEEEPAVVAEEEPTVTPGEVDPDAAQEAAEIASEEAAELAEDLEE